MQADRQETSQVSAPHPNITPEEWRAKVEHLHAANDLLQRQKADAEKDRELFREMYSKASAHVGEVIRENNALEERATLAEGQVREGIAMIKFTYEERIKKLEEEVIKWKGQYSILLVKDQRTDGDDVRQRAALTTELRAENAKLREELDLLREDYEKMEKVLEQLGEREMEQSLDDHVQEEELGPSMGGRGGALAGVQITMS